MFAKGEKPPFGIPNHPFRLSPLKGGAGRQKADGEAAMAFAILRTEKIHDWGDASRSDGHNQRMDGYAKAAHLRDPSTPNQPPWYRQKPMILSGGPDWLPKWKQRVGKMKLRKLKEGCRHVLAREVVLTASPEFFEGKTSDQVQKWAEANLRFLKKRFGAERLLFATMHLDEQTPHIHAYLGGLKLKPDGTETLSDRELGLGGEKAALSTLQSEYADHMKAEGFDLDRGMKGSKAKHQTIGEWRRQQAAPPLERVRLPKPPEPTLQDRLQIDTYAAKVGKEAAKEVLRQVAPERQQAKKVKRLEADNRRLEGRITSLETGLKALLAALEAVLGYRPNLSTLEGIKALKTAVMPFQEARAKAAAEQRPQKGEGFQKDAPQQGGQPRQRRGGGLSM